MGGGKTCLPHTHALSTQTSEEEGQAGAGRQGRRGQAALCTSLPAGRKEGPGGEKAWPCLSLEMEKEKAEAVKGAEKGEPPLI